MNILFLVKFYLPFDRGGSEWSTRDLAYLLTKKGHKVTILTPNYGAKTHEVIDGIIVSRIPFPIKLKKAKGQIAPYWTNNIIWFLGSSLYCLYFCIKNQYDLIHIQSNEMLPAGVIVSKILRKKSVATFRDYQVICNLGFCLWKNNIACNYKKYLENDFPFFYNNYVSGKNLFKYYVLKIAAIRARLAQQILKFFAGQVDYKIAVSSKVKEIFEANAVKNLKVIYNCVVTKNHLSKKKSDKIIYVGKLSKGKGIDLLFDSLPKIFEKLPEATLEVIGSGNLEKYLKTFADENNLSPKIIFSGHLTHNEVLETISNCALVVVPSMWQEPLPRSVIESLLSGIPVVATNVGGIGEIVINDVYGILSKPEQQDLEKAVINGFEKRFTLKQNILKDLASLKNKYSKESVDSYEKIYTEAIK